MTAPYRPRHIAPLNFDPGIWDQPRPRTAVFDNVDDLEQDIRDAAWIGFLGVVAGMVGMLIIIWLQS